MILKCVSCKRYSLHEVCPFCGGSTRSPHPMKFSLEDRYGSYRKKRWLNEVANQGS